MNTLPAVVKMELTKHDPWFLLGPFKSLIGDHHLITTTDGLLCPDMSNWLRKQYRDSVDSGTMSPIIRMYTDKHTFGMLYYIYKEVTSPVITTVGGGDGKGILWFPDSIALGKAMEEAEKLFDRPNNKMDFDEALLFGILRSRITAVRIEMGNIK